MTDAEIICTWMEPKPTITPDQLGDEGRESVVTCAVMGEPCNASGGGWWRWTCAFERGDVPELETRPLDLDALWEVEERLLEDLDLHFPYHAALCQIVEEESRNKSHDFIWHADANQRIESLAAVLRPIVEQAI